MLVLSNRFIDRNGKRLAAVTLLVSQILTQWSFTPTFAADQQAQTVAPENTQFKLFVSKIAKKSEELDALPGGDPQSFSNQLRLLNQAIKTDASSEPFYICARMDRFHDGSFSSLGELLPKLVPLSKKKSSPNLEFRTIKKLDVSQALQLTLDQNLPIAVSNQQLNVTKWNYAGALGGFAPTATLDLQTNGARRYTATLPRLPVNADTTQLSARVDYGLFQGGRVLFSAINTHELFLAQKGSFAAVRNDNLNFAAASYYDLLAAQASLNVRMDSALFCVKQLTEFKKLYIQQTKRAAEALTQSAGQANDFTEASRFSSNTSKILSEVIRQIRSTYPQTIKTAASSNMLNRLEEANNQLNQSNARKNSLGFTAKYVELTLKLLKANEEYKHTLVSTSNPDDGLPESTTGANDLGTKEAVESAKTRYKLLLELCNDWLRSFGSIKSDHPENIVGKQQPPTHLERLAELVKSPSLPTKAKKLLSGAAVQIALDDQIQQEALRKEVPELTTDLKTTLAILSQSVSDDMRKKVKEEFKEALKKIPESRWKATSQKSQDFTDLYSSVTTMLSRAAQVEDLSSAHKTEINSLLDHYATKASSLQRLTDNLTAIAAVNNAQIQKSKDVVTFLSTLDSLFSQLRSTLELNIVDDLALANQIDLLCSDLETSSRNSSSPQAIKLRTLISRLRENTRAMRSQSQVSQLLLAQSIRNLRTALAAETTEAGYAFQVDQWNTQLASDIQDILSQYITLRTSSIQLATLLNLDQRTCLLSAENTLACKARDLSYLGFVELTRQTLNNRPELFAFDELRRAALAKVAVAASALMPTVSVFGQINSAGTSNRFDTIHLVRSKSFGLQATYRFTNLLLPSMASVAAERATAIQAYLRFRDQLNIVMKEIHNSYIDVQTAKLRVATAIQKAQKATKQIEEANTPEQRMKASASNLDLITALRDRNTAMVDAATQIAKYNSSQAKLLRDSGQIYPISNFLAK